MSLTDALFHDRPPTCSVCGNMPGKATMGWRKDSSSVADMKNIQGDPEGCEVCKMVIIGLKSYQTHAGHHFPLPEYISIQCTPGRSMIVKRGIKKTPLAFDENQNSSMSRLQEQLTSEDIVGTQGLEFYIKLGRVHFHITRISVTNYETY